MIYAGASVVATLAAILVFGSLLPPSPAAFWLSVGWTVVAQWLVIWLASSLLRNPLRGIFGLGTRPGIWFSNQAFTRLTTRLERTAFPDWHTAGSQIYWPGALHGLAAILAWLGSNALQTAFMARPPMYAIVTTTPILAVVILVFSALHSLHANTLEDET